MEIKNPMLIEIKKDEATTRRRNLRWALIHPLYPKLFPVNPEKLNALPSMTRIAQSPSFAELKAVYALVVKRLNFQYFEARVKTEAEHKFAAEVRKATRLKFATSVWIGNRNVDFLFANIGFGKTPDDIKRGQGLVIEIDGEIHKNPIKMKKDEHKADLLHRLGIALTSVLNENLNHASVRAIIESLKLFHRLDTRGRMRVWKRIYLETIAHHASDSEFERLFGALLSLQPIVTKPEQPRTTT
jgi:very-short-patch-repair endonuclease